MRLTDAQIESLRGLVDRTGITCISDVTNLLDTIDSLEVEGAALLEGAVNTWARAYKAFISREESKRYWSPERLLSDADSLHGHDHEIAKRDAEQELLKVWEGNHV